MNRWFMLVVIAVTLSACQAGIPPEALQLDSESLQRRQLQTRTFDTEDEALLLQAGAGVMQDLGFSLDESETDVGVIVGSKVRDATEGGQVAGAIVMAALFGVYVPTDDEQKIRLAFVTSPLEANRTMTRVTFQRIVWNDQGNVSKQEFLGEPELYQQFYDKLSQSVFLTANSI